MIYVVLIVWFGSLIALFATQPHPIPLQTLLGLLAFALAGHVLPESAPRTWLMPPFVPHWFWPGALARILLILLGITAYLFVLWAIQYIVIGNFLDYFVFDFW